MTPQYKAHLKEKYPDIMLLIEVEEDLARQKKYVCAAEPILLTAEGAPFAFFTTRLFLADSPLASDDKHVLRNELARIALDDTDELNYRYLKRLNKLAAAVLVEIQRLLRDHSGLEGNNKDAVTQKETKKYH